MTHAIGSSQALVVVWKNVLATAAGVGILACAGTDSAKISRVAEPTWADGSRLATGQSVRIISKSSGDVGLWLLYEDRCEPDIIYNFVPAGTATSLDGAFCEVNGDWFAKLAFSDRQRRRLDLKSTNLWVPVNELALELRHSTRGQ